MPALGRRKESLMLSPKVLAELERRFVLADQSRVAELLGQYGGKSAERVHTVILRLADGDPAKVAALVEEAKSDYRDVLMAERSTKEKVVACLSVAAVLLLIFVWKAYA